MSSDVSSLHKVLKDETRRKILFALNEQCNLGYVELMKAIEITNTGTLNYHLKILGDLLEKNSSGQYTLSEKGRLAYKLLPKFPDDNNIQKRRRQKQFFAVAALSQIVYLISVLTLYYSGFIDVGRLILYTIWFMGGIGLAYFGYRVQTNMPKPGSEEERKRLKIGYPLLGGLFGSVISFFGQVGAILLTRFLVGVDLAHIEGGGYASVFLVVIGAILGAFIGYWFGKRNYFRKPKWAIWIDEKLGF